MPLSKYTNNPPGGITEIDPVKRPMNAEMLALMDRWGVTREELLETVMSGPLAPTAQESRDRMSVLIMEMTDGSQKVLGLVLAKLQQLDLQLRAAINRLVEKHAGQPRVEFCLPRDESEARATIAPLFEAAVYRDLPLTAKGVRIALYEAGTNLRARGVDVHFCFPV